MSEEVDPYMEMLRAAHRFAIAYRMYPSEDLHWIPGGYFEGFEQAYEAYGVSVQPRELHRPVDVTEQMEMDV